MATTPTTRPRLIGAAAIAPLVILAAITPVGIWEPLAVALGWGATACLAVGVIVGTPWGMGLGIALAVVRTGVMGQAGDRSPGLIVSTMLIVLALELASVSLEARTVPIDLGPSLVRAGMTATGAGLVVWVAGWLLQTPTPAGPGLLLIGLAAAFASAGLVLHFARRADPRR
jgi:hypothetical protein